jgi:amidase
MARRIDDLALLLPIIAGPDGEDPHVPPVALRDPADVDHGALRVAWFTDNGLHTPTSETIQAVQAAAQAIGSTGAWLTEVVPPGLDQAPDLWQRLVDADGKAWLARLLVAAGTTGRGSFASRADFHPPALSGAELTDLVERIDALRSNLLRWFGDFDVIVCPAMPQPAVRHGESYQPWFADTYSDVHNLTGWPAAVVRGGTSPNGLPIGVQLVARPWREDVALAAARVVESASGGWQPPPPI